MKFIYPAIIEKTNEQYHAYFPDLECCEAYGDTFDDVLRNAREAMYNWVDVELDEDEPKFPGLDAPEFEVPEGAEVRNILINYRFHDGWDE